jgi:ABC-type glycerol-3-phosphate transport system permease component
VYNRHRKLVRRNWVLFVILFIGALSMLFPFVWMTLSSFKTKADVYSYPPQWLPSVWTWQNFKDVFNMIPFLRYYGNSIYTSILQTVIIMAVSILAAYSLTKLAPSPDSASIPRLCSAACSSPRW